MDEEYACLTNRIAMGYSFGLESTWIREMLRAQNIAPLMIICKGRKDKPPKDWLKRLKSENYIIVKDAYEETWEIYESANPHKFSVTSFTNTILEWAVKQREQRVQPFNELYLGRKFEDKDFIFGNCTELEPPNASYGFKLHFPLWNWHRASNVLLLPPQIGGR